MHFDRRVFLAFVAELFGITFFLWENKPAEPAKMQFSESPAFVDSDVATTISEILINLNMSGLSPGKLLDRATTMVAPVQDYIRGQQQSVTDTQAYDRPIITARWKGRLGNQMFIYASLLGIASHQNMMPALPGDFPIRKYFLAPMDELPASKHPNKFKYKDFWESKPCKYDRRTEDFGDCPVCIRWYFQSWKYFDDIKDKIKDHFTFKNHINQAASLWLNTSIPESFQGKPIALIGVHVRRGDKIYSKKGERLPGSSYFVKAMDYFRQKESHPLFIICSEDPAWCQENIAGDDVVIAKNKEAAVDLAILTQCKHTVMSVGSFGWWAGYLAGGTVVYYKEWLKPGSGIARLVSVKDYFPPHWVPIGD